MTDDPVPSFPCFHHLRSGVASICLFGAIGTIGLAQAQSTSPVLQPDDLSARPAHWRFGAERIKLPVGGRLGLAHATYQVDVDYGFSAGPAVYGSVTGRYGGVSVLGVEGSWRRPLLGPLGVELGFFAGGGGGSGLPVRGGLMTRPHAALLWSLGGSQGGARVGLSVSRVRFGDIRSTQAGLVLEADTDFRYLAGNKLDLTRGSAPSGRTGVGFDRVLAVGGVMSPRGGSRRASGAKLERDFGLVGMRLEQALNDNAYWGLEVNGAVRGGVGGYAEYLATLGYEVGFASRYSAGARVALGMGGGGDVDVGGGLLAKAGVYGTVRLAREFGLTLETGYTRAPKGRLQAAYATAALNWILDDPSDVTAPLRLTRTEWIGGVERYRAHRRDGTSANLEAVTLKVNRFVTPSVYVTVQAHSAYGGNAGGYLAGLLGVGGRLPLSDRFHLGAEVLGGAAGGGNVDNRGGAMFQPSVYAGYDLSRTLALRAGVGRIKSVKGALDSTVVDAGLVYSFGVPGHGYR